MSERIRTFVDALPLEPHMRVLELGCGPGVAARLVRPRVKFVLGVDRSARALTQARRQSDDIAFLQADIESFTLPRGMRRFDLAFAMRVGALDGRHPELEARALQRIAAALKPGGRLFIDGGAPLRELAVPAASQRTRTPRSTSARRR